MEGLEAVESVRKGGMWALPDITGSVGVVTINLPRLTLASGGDDDRFFEGLEEALELAKEGLDWMRRRYCELARSHSAIYMMPAEYIPEVFLLGGSPFFSTVGLIGLPEAAAIMAGDPKLWLEPSSRELREAVEFMRKVLRHVVGKAREWSMSVGYPFNVEEVPGEAAAIRLASKDLAKYPDASEYILHDGVAFYSSSIAPYYADLDLAERIELESSLQKHFTGGVIMHIFLGEEPDPEALAKLVRKLTYNTELVYWSFTPAISVCPRCGWKATGLYRYCPKCGEAAEVWSRVIGYYRPLKNWYPMRAKEFWTRKHYRSVL